MMPARGKPARIKDVAEALSLSMCTVSRILNDQLDGAKYNPDTIRRVRQAAREMGCRPDLLARSLASGRSRTLGLCLADIANPLFSEFAAHFERRSAAHGFSTFVSNTSEDPDIEAHYVNVLLDRRVDCLVISPVSHDVPALQQQAAGQGCELVLFDRPAEVKGVWSVQLDNRTAMAGLTKQAIRLGHRRIGVLCGSSDDASLLLRLAGVKDGVAAAGLDPAEALLTSDASATTAAAGGEGLTELLNAPNPPTVVLSLANVLSQGALQAAAQRHVTLGRDIAFAGFDDFPGAEMVQPSVTVIAVPVRRMAELCADIACGKITSGRRERSVRTKLIRRQSLIAPAGS